MPSESEIRQAHAKAVGGQPKRCSKGKNCSAACIERDDACLIVFPIPASDGTSKVRDLVSNRAAQFPPPSQIERDVKSDDYFGKLYKVSRKIEQAMVQAAKNKDRKTYDRLENRLSDLYSKVQNSKGLPSYFPYPREAGKLWEVTRRTNEVSRFSKLRERLKSEMIVAADKNDKDRYDKIERKLLRLQKLTSNRTWLPRTSSIKEGEIWVERRKRKYEKVKAKVVEKLKRLASSGKEDSYNRLEAKLLEMQDKYGGKQHTKGSIWKSHSLEPIKDLGDFKRLVQKTAGLYNDVIRRSVDYTAKILGVKPSDNHDHKAKLAQLVKRLGSVGIKEGIRAIKKFTGDDYRLIRKSQKEKNIKSLHHKWGVFIENIINSPLVDKPGVVKFRGVTVNDETLSKLKSLSSGGFYSEGATSSWSTSLGRAADFSGSGLGSWGDNRVIFRTFNRRGMAVDDLSTHPGEYEILTTKKAKYRHISNTQVRDGGYTYHIFDLEEI
jgi:hypothetical protein